MQFREGKSQSWDPLGNTGRSNKMFPYKYNIRKRINISSVTIRRRLREIEPVNNVSRLEIYYPSNYRGTCKLLFGGRYRDNERNMNGLVGARREQFNICLNHSFFDFEFKARNIKLRLRIFPTRGVIKNYGT